MRSSVVPVALTVLVPACGADRVASFDVARPSTRESNPTYTNPVVSDDCPDPGVVHVEGPDEGYYAFCTTMRNALPDKFAIRRSRDLATWELVGHVFPKDRRPSWAVSEFWAPDVHRVGRRYVAFYAARDTTGTLCIGRAEADSILGPWHDLGRPFIRDTRVGMIDPHHFVDRDGAQYLFWKADTNALRPQEPTPIYGQRLSPDGLDLVGERVTLMTNDLAWEGDVVEGASIVARDGFYYLFYSANTFTSDRYATGVARARAPLGPYEKHAEPILRSNTDWVGPGHGSVVSFRGEHFYVYHAWQRGRVDPAWDKQLYPRMMLLDRVRWDKGWPRIHDGTPSAAPEPRPR